MSQSSSPEPDLAKAWIAAAIIWLAVVLALTSTPAQKSQTAQFAARACP